MKEFITKQKLREFGFLVGIGFPIFFGFLIPWIFGHDLRLWTLFFGLPLLFLAILNPKILFYPYKGWMNLGHFLGRINSSLILGFIYIVVLIPIAYIMKIFKYDPLRKKRFETDSYFENKREHKIDLTKIF